MENIQQIVDTIVRPRLQGHGGDIEFLGLTPDGYAKVRLRGACAGCPGAQQTLSDVVEAALLEAGTGIKGVIPCYEADADLIKQALSIIRTGRINRD